MTTQQAVPSTDVSILVVSCDAYRDLWEPFFGCFFKYWPDCPYPVYLGANFATYPDGRVRSLSIGPDSDYSSNLIAMLQRIDASWVILWIEDRLLAAPVDTARVTNLVAAAQNQDAGFVKLIASHPYAMEAGNCREFGLIPQGTPYRVCMTVGLWHKATLLRLLQPGETAWQIERLGSRRSDALDKAFCALSYPIRHSPPLRDTHVIVKGRLFRDAIPFLRREKLLEKLGTRQIQEARFYFYVKAYLMYLDFRAKLRWVRRHGLK